MQAQPDAPYPPDALRADLLDARRRTLELQRDLSDAQLLVPPLAIVNPPLWELGHVAWFQEKWILRRGGRDSILPQADRLWDSSAVAHDARWSLPLPARAAILGYAREVLERALEALPAGEMAAADAYFYWLALMHEDMHGEAFTYTRQTLGYPAPAPVHAQLPPPPPAGPVAGDALIPGGGFLLGARANGEFVFDNEQWAHPVEVAPFAMARAAVTQGEFAAFVEAGGYARSEFWSAAGWAWRAREDARHPVYWRREGKAWAQRHFDQWCPLAADLPMIHVNWHEAEAWCRWARRRLPSEAEWELAAAAPREPAQAQRRFPWGDQPPSAARARLDAAAIGCVAVHALPAGDSGCGCRQMIGNVWEWTADAFAPYPGFVAGPYKEYSQPWFTPAHRVLRGGCWATRARLIRNTWRNFYTQDRRDVFAGFRTCALSEEP